MSKSVGLISLVFLIGLTAAGYGGPAGNVPAAEPTPPPPAGTAAETASAPEMAPAYDPLAVPDGFEPVTLDLTVDDTARTRTIPVLVYLPAVKDPASVVMFSHGLGGSREGCAYLGRHWSGRGYVAVFIQHPGSDTSVWKDKPIGRRMAAMREAANAQNFLLRVKDVPAVLNQLEAWSKTEGHGLMGRLDMSRVGMSGHSFGAVTTQAVSGQTAAGGNISVTDPRIKAAIMFSPSSPRQGDPVQAFANVKIPWMLMTGTNDVSPIGDQDVASRLAVFPALLPGGKYELVLDGAAHSAFADRGLPGDAGKRNPNHHRVILALSTAFWDAYLKNDAAAQTWLDGTGPSTVMEPADRWQIK
ncbi:MAG: dienelactone hydrolase [Planctomycetota bacterium]